MTTPHRAATSTVTEPQALRHEPSIEPSSRTFIEPSGSRLQKPKPSAAEREKAFQQKRGSMEVVQNRIAKRLGAEGWLILQGISASDLQMLTAMQKKIDSRIAISKASGCFGASNRAVPREIDPPEMNRRLRPIYAADLRSLWRCGSALYPYGFKTGSPLSGSITSAAARIWYGYRHASPMRTKRSRALRSWRSTSEQKSAGETVASACCYAYRSSRGAGSTVLSVVPAPGV
jgi:hypothetical protein